MRAIAKSAVSVAAVKGVPVASRVILLLAMAHFSSPAEEVARVSFAISISEAVRLITSGSMEMWGMRVIGLAAADAITRTVSGMAVVRLLFSLVGGVVAAVLTYFLGNAGFLLAALSLIFVIAGEGFGVAVIYHLARSSAGALVPVAVITGLLATACSVGMLAVGIHPALACAGVAIGETVAALYALGAMRTAGILARVPGIAAACASVLREAAPATAFSSIVAIYSRLDAIVLNAFSVTAFATYTVAFRASQPFSFVFGSVALAVYASIVRDSSLAHVAGRARFRKTLGAIFATAALAAVVTYGVCAGLIRAFAPIYSDSLGALLLLCVTMPFVAINNVCLYAIGGEGRFKTLVGLALVNLLSTSGLMLLLVPDYGATGAAMALLGCQLLSGLLLLVLGLRRSGHRLS